MRKLRQRRYVTYQQGDEVMLNTKNIRIKVVGTPKLLPRWVGPFDVKEVISKAAARLDVVEIASVGSVYG
jgi:hypothetical protein